MLKHLDYGISGYSSVEVNRGADECEKRFNKLSIEERLKFNKENLVNFNNIRKQSAPSHTDYVVCNKYIVVTIVVAASGFHELPSVKSRELLKIALEKLASIPSNDIKAADVLWTPQKEDDSLTEKEVLKDFPLLLPL
ncbi:FLUCTUATING-LIGHT-ACCLIMATION protein 1, chloroplastic-like [Bidens hawaiensis]|uniref:FLUCTUATING-LIGHT-ACCLIMATION protein 1, chloroplastic-like n=1 Tax=Bidens hawaiensis TaxID=980011 RepID=UPI0040498FA0